MFADVLYAAWETIFTVGVCGYMDVCMLSCHFSSSTLQRPGCFDFSFAKVGEARALQVPVAHSLFLHKMPTRFPYFLLHASMVAKENTAFQNFA